MKNYLLVVLCLTVAGQIKGQSNVGIGLPNPDPSALLHLESTAKGLLIPRMSTLQRTAITTPANGLLVFDTDSDCVFFYKATGSVWVSLCSILGGGGGVTGATGPAGLQGVTGASGAPGVTGPTGPLGAAGGDLSGNYPNPTVVGLQGYPVSNTAPVGNSILQFNGTSWTPTNPNSLFWQLTGNSGTTPSTAAINSPVNNDFIGTTDNHDFVTATNNFERMRITGAGNVGINTTTPGYKLSIFNGTAGAIQINDGTQAQDYVLTSDAVGVGTWKPVAVKATYGVLGAGVDIPYTTPSGTYYYTGTTLTLPPGKYSVFVSMLLTPNQSYSPANSAFWVRSTFSDVSVTPVPSPDIIGSIFVSGCVVGPSKFGLAEGILIINNTSGSNKTYYYAGGFVDINNTTQTITGFGGNAWNEDNIIATPLQ